MRYGDLPVELGKFSLECKEMMFYQYLPIKLEGQSHISMEDRLKIFEGLIGKILCDYIGAYGLDSFIKSNVYLTVKNLYQTQGCSFNRQGWHTDGFGTADINYIWCDRNPTVFNVSDFNLSNDDVLSMQEMEQQADFVKDYIFPITSILRLTPFVVHRVNPIQSEGLRAFVKVSISPDKYNLDGNSHNYLLSYDWDMLPRDKTRNVPAKSNKL